MQALGLMRKVFATVVATTGAALAPAAVFTLILLALGRTEALPVLPVALTSAFIVALAHAVVLGLPTVWALLRAGRFHFRTMLLSGFAIGFLPMAIWSWPYRPSPVLPAHGSTANKRSLRASLLWPAGQATWKARVTQEHWAQLEQLPSTSCSRA